MNTNLTKSLTDLIDETLLELEELRKSRFSAAEIKIEGPGEGIAGKPSDGDLHAKKAEDKDDKEDKDMDKGESCAKDESAMDKKEDKDDKKDDDKEPHKDDPKHEEKEKKIAKDLLDMHKSIEDTSSLMKSYVEERVKPLEDKLSTILDLVNKIADQPIAPKGASFKATPLLKSNDEGVEPLSKAQVANKLLELKKSGTKVESVDITKAEMGQDLNNLIKKYEIS